MNDQEFSRHVTELFNRDIASGDSEEFSAHFESRLAARVKRRAIAIAVVGVIGACITILNLLSTELPLYLWRSALRIAENFATFDMGDVSFGATLLIAVAGLLPRILRRI